MLFPEEAAGGYSHRNGTTEFYGRINALLRPEMTLLDFGAGRGKGLQEDPAPYQRRLRHLRGRCRKVVGVDVDPAVTTNPGLDRALVIEPTAPLPLTEASVDLILSDYVLEHLDDPARVAAEFDRVLKPGGWICARTPNRWGYVGLGARLIPNRWHVRLLRRLQPERQERDVFPVRYRLNSMAALRRYFPAPHFSHHAYFYSPEPDYFGHSEVASRLALFAERLMPRSLLPVLMVFVHKAPVD